MRAIIKLSAMFSVALYLPLGATQAGPLEKFGDYRQDPEEHVLPFWDHYSNSRFGFHINIPPQFTVALPEPANGDGRTFQTEDQRNTLYTWAGYNIVADDFKGAIDWEIEHAQEDGWTITYRKQTPRWASWSGTLDSRIFYERAVQICGNAIAYFLLVYDRSDKEAYDPNIPKVVKSLQSDICPSDN